MPIAFARMEVVKKSAGRPMGDKLDYLSRRGRYASHGGLVAGPMTILPMGAPGQYRDERQLWSDAEEAERFGYVIAQELLVALPRPAELPTAHAKKFCHALARQFSDDYGIAVTYALHSDAVEAEQGDTGAEPEWPSLGVGESNAHAHFLLGSRQLGAAGFSPRRHKSLLPDIGGWTVSPSAATAQVHTVDATNFRSLVAGALERYCDRTGLALQLRLPAIHPGYHVGPTAAVRALINDIEALTRRPDADAIFRKLDRLRVNAEIEKRNVAAIAAIEPLVEHLSDRRFTRREVEDLVHRYCADGAQSKRIVEAVLARTLNFYDTEGAAGSRFHILPEFRAREQHIGNLAAQLQAGTSGSGVVTPLVSVQALAEMIGGQAGLWLLDLTDPAKADALEQLAQAIKSLDRPVVMATHLNKRREPPPDIPLRALHWSGDLVLPDGCTVILDEADCVTLPLLEKLLAAAVAAKADVVFCRRSYRGELIPNPTLSAIVAGYHFVLGSGVGNATDLPFDLASRRSVQFVDDADAASRLAAELVTRMPAGRKVYFLCADPLMTRRLEGARRAAKRNLSIGPLVPEEWTGAVVVLYSPLLSARHLRSIAKLQPRFLVPRTVAAGTEELVRQLRLSLGQLTTLTEPVQAGAIFPSPKWLNLGRPADDVRLDWTERSAIMDAPWNMSYPDVRSDDDVSSEADGMVIEDDDPELDLASSWPDDEDDDADPELSPEPEAGDDPDDDPG
jgi:hypothetical protein